MCERQHSQDAHSGATVHVCFSIRHDWLVEWDLEDGQVQWEVCSPHFLFLSAFLLSSTSFLFLHPHPRRHALRHTRTKKSTLDMKIRKVMIEFINSAVNQIDHSYRLKWATVGVLTCDDGHVKYCGKRAASLPFEDKVNAVIIMSRGDY